MPSHDTPIATRDGLALLLGPRQADIMQLIWTYGDATVRELHEHLKREYDITYTTVMTVCVRLCEKGLLERRQIRPEDGRTQSEQSYIYTPRMSQAAFVRTAVEAQLKQLITHFPSLFGAPLATSPLLREAIAADRGSAEYLLAYLGTLKDADGCPVADTALDQVAALLERAEAAEQRAAAWEKAARGFERRGVSAERRVRTAQKRLKRFEQVEEQARAAAEAVPFEMPNGMCRVCGRPAPPAHGNRKDGLRVCKDSACRVEARRRDCVIKQRRYNERQQPG